MKKFTTKDLALSSIVGALYVALVFAFFFISFSDIQFRIAEVLLILVIFNPKLAFGIILGTFVANTFAPGSFGIIDGVFGTLATMVGLIGLIAFRKKPIIGLLFPILANGAIVSFMLVFFTDVPATYWLSFASVSIGQAVVLYGLGLPLYYYFKRNDHLIEKLQ